MGTGNSCKKSLSVREFSVRVLWVFLMISCWVSSAGAVDFWDITVVDSTGDVGQFCSVAILPSDYPGISYYDDTNRDLKYAWYDGTAWQTTTVDSDSSVGSYTSLAVLPSGYPAISYWRYGSPTALKYAWYDGSAWQTMTVDPIGYYGDTSLAVLPSGQPAISYHDSGNKDLKYAWYDGSAWQTTIVDSTGDMGRYNSLAVLPSGQPAISYNSGHEVLKYAWFDGSAWQTTVVAGSFSSAGSYNSLAILPSGQPAISCNYWTNPLKYAWYDGSAWQTTTVDNEGGGVQARNSLAILPSGHPAVSYGQGSSYDYGPSTYHNYDLRYAWYDGSNWHKTAVPGGGDVGRFNSLGFLPSGQPGITYYANGALKFATPLACPSAPVTMMASYTATAKTDKSGTTVVIDGPAYSEWSSLIWGGFSSVSLETTDGGHLQGVIALYGADSEACFEPGVDCYSISCGDANGTVTGTLDLDTSESYLAGTELELTLQVFINGDPGDAEDYHLQLWRGASLLGQIDPCAPEEIVVPVFAGETLTFELFASEEDWYGDYQGYDRSFEFRLILRGLANFDGKGTVDFRDYAIFALHWLDTGCVEPTWCGKADLDKSTDVDWSDFKIFTDHWLE